MILQLKNIYKTYVQGKMEVPVLKNISLDIEAGDYVAIMGPSGSGKTTLMNIIGCLDYATRGEYTLGGENIMTNSDANLSEVRLRSIGFVFQSFYLLSRQSALENVALPLLYAGVKKRERLDIAFEALQRVGLEDRVDFLPTQLSGGQCQRVAIARAMVNRPKILLADEPTGALDTTSGQQIMEIFQRLNDEGVTIVMITHEREIADHAKTVYHIRDGRFVDTNGNFIAPDHEEAQGQQEAPEQIPAYSTAETLQQSCPPLILPNTATTEKPMTAAVEAPAKTIPGKSAQQGSPEMTPESSTKPPRMPAVKTIPAPKPAQTVSPGEPSPTQHAIPAGRQTSAQQMKIPEALPPQPVVPITPTAAAPKAAAAVKKTAVQPPKASVKLKAAISQAALQIESQKPAAIFAPAFTDEIIVPQSIIDDPVFAMLFSPQEADESVSPAYAQSIAPPTAAAAHRTAKEKAVFVSAAVNAQETALPSNIPVSNKSAAVSAQKADTEAAVSPAAAVQPVAVAAPGPEAVPAQAAAFQKQATAADISIPKTAARPETRLPKQQEATGAFDAPIKTEIQFGRFPWTNAFEGGYA